MKLLNISNLNDKSLQELASINWMIPSNYAVDNHKQITEDTRKYARDRFIKESDHIRNTFNLEKETNFRIYLEIMQAKRLQYNLILEKLAYRKYIII